MRLYWDIEVTSTSEFVLNVFDRFANLLKTLLDGVGDLGISRDVVSLFWHGNVKSVEECLGFLGVFCLLGESVVQ